MDLRFQGCARWEDAGLIDNRWTASRLAMLGLLLALSACGESPVHPTSENGEPRQVYRFTLEQPDVDPLPVLPKRLAAWRDSLVRNLGHQGAVNSYLRIDAAILDQQTGATHWVYVNMDNPAQFYARVPSPVLVDFGERSIGTSGVAGISFHPHPGGELVVALFPRGVDVLGVRLGEPKTGSAPHEISDRVAHWTW